MSVQEVWVGPRYVALRAGARLLPHGEDSASVQKVRQVSASLSDQDDGFKGLRGKIHGTPDAGDAQRVRDYAAGVSDAVMKAKYLELADEIDRVYQAAPLAGLLESRANVYSAAPWLQKILRDAAAAYRKDDSAANRYQVTASLLAEGVNITAGLDLSLGEFSEVGDTIEEFASEEATVVAGGLGG